jgi:hypothetical protein
MLPTVTTRAVSRGHAGPREGRRAPGDGQLTSRTPLLLRLPSAVLVTLVLGTAFHVAAGAAAAPPAALLRTAAVLALLWAAVCRNELGLRQLVMAVWTSQAVVHFMLLPQELDVMAASSSPCPMPGGTGPSGTAMQAGDTGWQALVAHGVAGLLTAWWLRRGERRVWAAARRTAREFLALLTPRLTGRRRCRTAGFAAPSTIAASAERWTACQRRGPPMFVAAC